MTWRIVNLEGLESGDKFFYCGVGGGVPWMLMDGAIFREDIAEAGYIPVVNLKTGIAQTARKSAVVTISDDEAEMEGE